MNAKHLAHYALVALLALGLVGFVSAGSAAAQSTAPSPSTTPPTPAPEGTRPEHVKTLAAWDSFLQQHPDLREHLQQNPSLLGDKSFVTQHPELDSFLKAHPDFAKAAAKNPERAMRAGERVHRNEGRIRARAERHRMNH